MSAADIQYQPQLLPDLLLPFKETGSGISLNEQAYTERLLGLAQRMQEIANRNNIAPEMTGRLGQILLGTAPVTLQRDVQEKLFPVLGAIVSGDRVAQAQQYRLARWFI